MLHTKSRGNLSTGSGFYHIYMRAWWSCSLCHVNQIPRTNFCPWRLHTKFGFKLIGKAVSEEEIGVRKMTKIILYLFAFETKTLARVAPVPGHALPLTFQYVPGRLV